MKQKVACLLLERERPLRPEWIRCLLQRGCEITSGKGPDFGSAREGSFPERVPAKQPDIPFLLVWENGNGGIFLAALNPHRTAHLDSPDSTLPLDTFLESLQPPSSDVEMVGSSAAVDRTRRDIRHAAPSDATVLITGESGTGKELVAQMIHGGSPRRDRPFVCVNCAAIPEHLLESELFGYQKGAFTGAECPRDGRFSEAEGGTLFLDEIGDMSHYAQGKVLRAIETRQIDRLGGRAGLAVNIRIVAATNRNLEEMVASGAFRQDLYFRLNVVQIHLPPLRERLEDLPALVRHYIAYFNRRFRCCLEGVTDATLELLRGHKWPGNIRELRNLFEAIYVNPPPRIISAEDLPEWFQRRCAPTGPSERERLLATLASTNWNKSEAAKRLNWSRVTLYRKLARYQLSAARPSG